MAEPSKTHAPFGLRRLDDVHRHRLRRRALHTAPRRSQRGHLYLHHGLLGALLLWAILIPALGRSAWGQNSVSGAIQGFVYDKDDRSPILEAKIVITNQ